MLRLRLLGLITLFLVVIVVMVMLGVGSTNAVTDQAVVSDGRLNLDSAAPAALYATDGMFVVVDATENRAVLNIAAADLACTADVLVATALDGKYAATCYAGGFGLVVDEADEVTVYMLDSLPPTTLITQTFDRDGNLTGHVAQIF